MLRFAICDDDNNVINRIEDYLYNTDYYKVDYDSFSSGESLLNYFDKTNIKYDVYFLDIEMQGKNGLEVAREIRKNDLNAIIVFLTNYCEFIEQAFEVLAFRYIKKPITSEKFNMVFNDIIQYFELSKKKFMFQYDKEYFTIDYNQIIGIEKVNRLLHIHTKDQIYKCNLSVSDALKQLNEKIFVKIYPSLIVNLEYVKILKKESIVLDNNKELPLSRRNKDIVKQKFIEFAKDRMCK